MRTAGLCLTCGASLLPLVLESAAPELDLEPARAALVLLPWAAFAPLPRAAPAAGTPARAALEVALFALPPLALALGLERADGRVPWAGAGVGFALVVLWTLASELGATPRASRVYALLWLALVPGLAALSLALGWAGRTRAGGAPELAALSRANPLEWIYRSGGDGILASGAASAVGLAVLVLACIAFVRGRGTAGSAA